MQSPHDQASGPWFFDLLISNIPAAIYNALAILYYGSSDGAFMRKSHVKVDLRTIQAIKVSVSNTSCKFLSNDYEFNLVFYSRAIADSIWEPSNRQHKAELKRLMRRVSFNHQPSLHAKRPLGSLFVRQEHQVHFAKLEEMIVPDHYVPASYHYELFHHFEVYIMRSPTGFPLVRSLFKAQGREMNKRIFASHHSLKDEEVVTYTLKHSSGQ